MNLNNTRIIARGYIGSSVELNFSGAMSATVALCWSRERHSGHLYGQIKKVIDAYKMLQIVSESPS